MTPRAEEFMRLMREALRKAAEHEHAGQHSTANRLGQIAAASLATALRMSA